MALKLTGGSVTLSIAVLTIAWTIRSLRDKRRRSTSPTVPANSSSKYFAELSLEAIALLVHLEAIPYYFIDVRSSEDAAAAPLASWVNPAVNIPEPQLQTGLKQPASWHFFTAASASLLAAQHGTADASTPAVAAPQQQQQQQQRLMDLPLPTKQHLLIVLAQDEQQQQLAACRAAAAGFDRVAVPSCGIEQLLQVRLLNSTISRDQQVTAAAAAAAVQFPVIHADALAVLLGLAPLPEAVWQLLCQQYPNTSSSSSFSNQQQQQRGGSGHSPGHTRTNSGSMLAAAGEAAEGAAAVPRQQRQQQQRLLLLDVRRHNERTLYGAIPGAHHVPADELASALQLRSAAFRRRYHFEPPDRGADVLVLHSRASSRAQWAAQVCLDAGYNCVFVYPEGVLGWQFGGGVQPYPPYQQGDKPPAPEVRLQLEPAVASGVMELQQLGLVPLLMQQHGVSAAR